MSKEKKGFTPVRSKGEICPSVFHSNKGESWVVMGLSRAEERESGRFQAKKGFVFLLKPRGATRSPKKPHDKKKKV